MSTVPGDDLYIQKPQPLTFYQQLGGIGGARQMNLMSTWHCAHLSPPHCAITQSGINFVLDVLGGFLNASDYAKEMYAAGRWYAYGWDQSPWQAWPAVKSLYSAVKEKFPLLSTAAVLESAPNGLPCLPPVLDSCEFSCLCAAGTTQVTMQAARPRKAAGRA